MSHWILKALLTLAIAVLMFPFAQRAINRLCGGELASGNCGGGACGNFRSTQELLDRNTLRFGQSLDTHTIETSR